MERFAAFVPVLIGIASAAAGPNPPQYSARFITPGISAVNASGMNAFGDVVGTGTTGSGAWVSRRGAPAELLPLPPGTQYAFANDINDAGVIVGSVGPSSYPDLFGTAAAWIPNASGGYTIRVLGLLPGHLSSNATAVNEVEDIVGWSRNGMFRFPVLFMAQGGVQDLSSTGVFDPKEINDHRVLVDDYARRLDLNTMIVEDLGLPGGSYRTSVGEAINNSGQVAGSVILATSTNCDHRAARYTNGIGWEVLSSCGSANSVWDMNDLGDVVMRLNIAPYVRFEGNGTFLIEDLIVANVGHWYVINGYGLAINNARQLAVPASNPATNESGIILLTQRCIADVDDGSGTGTPDGGVGIEDLLYFLVIYDAGQIAADVDDGSGTGRPDGGVGIEDLLYFLQRFDAGC